MNTEWCVAETDAGCQVWWINENLIIFRFPFHVALPRHAQRYPRQNIAICFLTKAKEFCEIQILTNGCFQAGASRITIKMKFDSYVDIINKAF